MVVIILYSDTMGIQNPHDKFFKKVFSNKETATDYFKHYLPVEISSNIDFQTLMQDNNSYIDEELKEYFSDLIYRCRYRGKNNIDLVLLFEHKSYVPEYPHLQLLKYLLKIWESNLKQEKKLVPVIPMVFYHGKDKWEMKPFAEYFKNLDETLTAYIPEIRYLLTDLSRFTDEEIKQGVFESLKTKVTLLIMKNAYDEERLLKIFIDCLELDSLYFTEEKGLPYLEAVLRYLFSNVEKVPIEEIQKKIAAISVRGGEFAMTLEEKLIEKGELQGIKKGKLEGKIEGKIEGKMETAKRMKEENFGLDVICRLTGLSVEEIQHL
jgi:predicted transposase/invertase (TIGR01784 family)